MKNTMWSVVVLVLLGGIAAAYYYWQLQVTPPPAPVSQTQTPPAPAKAEPAIRHPVRAAPSTEEPLPPLGESDAAMQDTLAELFTRKSAVEFFYLKEIVRRFVVTVDNLPRKKVPMQYRLFKPVPGKFLVTGEGENFLLASPENYRRYTPYVFLTNAVDIRKLVEVYVRFYPLFQQEYQNLGYPKGYFNDRLVEAIDDLLAAPDVPGRIKLVRPNVLYQFADPNLEDLSAGQKIMIRLGSENAARIKARLRDFRRELTGQSLKP